MTKTRVRYYPGRGFFLYVPRYSFGCMPGKVRLDPSWLGPWPTLDEAVGLFTTADVGDTTRMKTWPCDFTTKALRAAFKTPPGRRYLPNRQD